MKRLLTILSIFVLFGFFISNASAQNVSPDNSVTTQQTVTTTPETVTDTSSLFDVEVYFGTQNPWDKSVPIYIKFRSSVTADNVEISWDSPSGVTLKKNHAQFVKVEEGKVYTYKATLKPNFAGTYNIAGNVTLWQYNTNYTSSGNTSIVFGDDFITIPQTAGYTGAVIVQYILIAFLVIFIGIAGYFGGKFGLKLLKEWLKPPE